MKLWHKQHFSQNLCLLMIVESYFLVLLWSSTIFHFIGPMKYSVH